MEKMPIMCIHNFKKLKMLNGSIYTLDAITPTHIKVNDIEFTHAHFAQYFESNFAMTIFKYQGSTIRESYTIHEANIMSKREMYTSLSRGIALDKVHFKFNTNTYKNVDVSKPSEKIITVNNDVDEKYLEGKIYKITFGNHIYIGSTINSLEERMNQHLSKIEGSLFIETLKQNKKIAKIKLVKNYPYSSRRELEIEEMKNIEAAFNDESALIVLNTLGKGKAKKVRDTIIDLVRVEELNMKEEKIDIIDIIEYKSQQLYRFRNKDIDIKVSWNSKRTQQEAQLEIQQRVDDHKLKL